MRYSAFEQHIASTLKKDEVGLDIQALINDIHGKKKKDRKMLFFWLKSLSVITIALIPIYFFVGSTNLSAVLSNTSLTSINVEINEIQQSGIKMVAKPENQSDVVIAQNDVKHGSRDNEKIIDNQKHKTKGFKSTSSNINEPVAGMISFSIPDINDKDAKDIYKTDERTSGLKIEEIPPVYTLLVPQHKGILRLGTDKIVCPSFSNKSKLFLEFIPEIGLFMPIKTLENVSGESNNIFTLRNQGEKSLEGLQAALHMRLRKGKSPFYIQAGLSYSRLTEKMKLDYSYTRKDTTQGIISITVSQTGDTITTIYGDIVKERTLSGSKIAHHSFSLIDIPVAVGYEKKFNEWVLGIEGGIMFNISSTASGKILSSDTSFTSINFPSNNYRSSLGLSYFAGLSIGKDFNNVGRFYLALRARAIPASFSGDQNKIKQTYQFVGLNVGYVYTF